MQAARTVAAAAAVAVWLRTVDWTSVVVDLRFACGKVMFPPFPVAVVIMAGCLAEG
ncbi:hypothetical protein HanRHA438_Chr07g0305441 [Helianthus annuus]|nr:hypothetical protein HanRHA438_Chr07g0305441 [Helianthus annuus]